MPHLQCRKDQKVPQLRTSKDLQRSVNSYCLVIWLVLIICLIIICIHICRKCYSSHQTALAELDIESTYIYQELGDLQMPANTDHSVQYHGNSNSHKLLHSVKHMWCKGAATIHSQSIFVQPHHYRQLFIVVEKGCKAQFGFKIQCLQIYFANWITRV